jgi:hypothetical protein
MGSLMQVVVRHIVAESLNNPMARRLAILRALDRAGESNG